MGHHRCTGNTIVYWVVTNRVDLSFTVHSLSHFNTVSVKKILLPVVLYPSTWFQLSNLLLLFVPYHPTGPLGPSFHIFKIRPYQLPITFY
jgi:hypothetical protein